MTLSVSNELVSGKTGGNPHFPLFSVAASP
jgi:hypothetical protein